MQNLNLLDFERGKIYNRREDIHARFGGQQQGGISTPKSVPAIFLFTGEGGEAFGYKDGWDENGVFRLFGEGQKGDMSFKGGNAAILNHAREGKDLYLFGALGKGKGVRFLGVFACAGYNEEKGLDANRTERNAIVFHLVPVNTQNAVQQAVDAMDASKGEDIAALRKRAYEASKIGKEISTKTSLVSLKQRSADVAAYVLRRADGVCECCRNQAPFKRKDGRPYLEPHHTQRLADDGPDNPAWVAGVCPNCHREIHFGQRGDELNSKLKAYLDKVEASAV